MRMARATCSSVLTCYYRLMSNCYYCCPRSSFRRSIVASCLFGAAKIFLTFFVDTVRLFVLVIVEQVDMSVRKDKMRSVRMSNME